jgi:hypothetical protein
VDKGSGKDLQQGKDHSNRNYREIHKMIRIHCKIHFGIQIA